MKHDKQPLTRKQVAEIRADGRFLRIEGRFDDKFLAETGKEIEALIRSKDKHCQDLVVMLSSGGGRCHVALQLHDELLTLQELYTVHMVVSRCSSAANYILAAVPKEHRYALPQASFLLHPVRFKSEGTQNKGPEGNIPAFGWQLREEGVRLEGMKHNAKAQVQLLSRATGLPTKRVRRMTEDVTYLKAKQALKMGLVSHILQ